MNWNQYLTGQQALHTHLDQQLFTADQLGHCLIENHIAANAHEVDQIGTLLLNSGQISAQDPNQTRFERSNKKQYRYDADGRKSTHLRGRVNPLIYDLVIIGGGYAGLSAAFRAVSVGLQVALIYEPHPEYRHIIQRLKSSHDNVQHDALHDDINLDRLSQVGCDLYPGSGRFTSTDTVRISDDVQLRFRKAIIATGSCRTSTIMSQLDNCLKHCTKEDRVVVLGSIPRALEICYQLSGICCKVILLCKQDLISSLQPHHLNDILSVLYQAGIQVVLVSKFVRISDSELHPERARIRALFLDSAGLPSSVQADYVIDLIDNRANIQNLGLDLAGVKYTDMGGIQVDDFYVTANRNICAVGDCITARHYRSWDLAQYQGLEAVTNVFVRLRRCSDLILPVIISTSPKIAQVVFVVKPLTATESDLERYREPIENGFLEIVVNAGSGHIISAFAIGLHADLLIMSLAGIMPKDTNLSRLALIAPIEPSRSVCNIARRIHASRASPHHFLLRRIYRRLIRIIY